MAQPKLPIRGSQDRAAVPKGDKVVVPVSNIGQIVGGRQRISEAPIVEGRTGMNVGQFQEEDGPDNNGVFAHKWSAF